MASLNDIETKVYHIIDLLKDRTIKTITGVLPLTFTTTEDKLRDWEIRGNDDVYEGQQGVGERTENLFDKTQYAMVPVDNQGATRCGTAIPITDGTYTLSFSKDTTRALFIHTILNGSITSGVNVTSLSPYTFTLSDVDTLIIRSSYPTLTPWDESGYTNIMLVEGSTAPSTYISYGYQIPLTVSQQGQPDKTVDIYIGDSPLTEGETVSKASTGVDIELFEGENTISTTLYNKPEMTIKYKY